MADKKRRARGEGSIRQRKDGTWEARFVVGIDPGTGKEIRKSVYAKTQKEVRKRMTEAVAAIDKDDYREPCKMTLAQWLDIWEKDYLRSVKPSTVLNYTQHIKNHIKPALGAVRLDAINAHTIQKFYNNLAEGKGGKPALSAKTVKNVHGVLHKALKQAVMLGYIGSNPADACNLPRIVQKEIKPLDEDATATFIKAIQGHRYETVFLVTLFTGMRQGEVLGLTWDCVNLDDGAIIINKQIQKQSGGGSAYALVQTKNSRGRAIAPAPFVIELLREQKRRQAEWRERAGECWEGCQLGDMVFTDELGRHLMPHTVYHNFKRVVVSIGLPNARFHDLRHSYAVAAIRSGDDIKTVQGNLGHATASFTLDKYGHVTEQMKRASADRMQQYIDRIKKTG